MKVFITGATGFVGQHFCGLLDSKEYEVYGTSYPQPPPPGATNILHLDIRDEFRIEEAVRKIRPDWIFHLAAVSNVRSSWERRKETLETNIAGAFYLFEAVRKHSPKARVLFISSSDVYGSLAQGKTPLKEEDPYHVINPYAYSKVSGELLCRFYAEIENLDIVIARPFPHTGPGQAPEFVCSDWARQVSLMEKGKIEPILEVGNLDVRRDYTDVRDVVRAYRLLLEKGRKGEVYNVCSGTGVSLKEILEIFLSLRRGGEKSDPAAGDFPVSIRVDPAKLRKVDIPLLVGSNEKIRKETSWEPRISLKQTLGDLLDGWRRTDG